MLNFFAQRTLTGIIDNYELIGKADGMLASGNFKPEAPFFSFQFPIAIQLSGYAISKEYAATDKDDILEIVKILKALRDILFKRINYTRDKK